jgi:lipopolysaccharide transport system ATP-binding protein
MSSKRPAVRVENLGKRYLIPKKRNPSSLTAHLKDFIPFFRDKSEDYFWALKDVSFEVQPGEILGILGKNGSGKSTLLKILSNVTFPTEGRAELSGRVGSLLEVGTGFHPDLTGRENVFMAGSLLGLKGVEIKSKFDQIVDFSGIEKFIDVPVKRYSSGMYVRLAYAVVSMLKSEILILDEVMAVGDAAFREKSRDNIARIAAEGCTILFVSHNARAISGMCRTGIILDDGKCVFQGSSKDAVAKYMRKVHHFDANDNLAKEIVSFQNLANAGRLNSEKKVLEWVSTHKSDGRPASHFKTGETLMVRIGYKAAHVNNPYFAVLIQNEFAERVATIHSTHAPALFDFRQSGYVECVVPDIRLGDGTYRLMLDFGNYAGTRALLTSLDCVPNAVQIHVELGGYLNGIGLDAYQGAVHKSSWIYRSV